MHRGITWLLEHSDNYKTAIELYSLYPRYTLEFGVVNLETFKRYCRKAAKYLEHTDLAEKEDEVEEPREGTFIRNQVESQDNLSLEIVSYQLRTKEELLNFANIDMNIWEVDKYVISRWGNAKSPQYQLKCWLKRKTHLNREDYKEIFAEIVKNKNIVTPPYTVHKKNENNMVEIGLADFHFGMKARKEETGQDSYDLDIARDLMIKCVDYYVSKLKGVPVERIILPVVGDFFNCDFNYSTTKGTLQDEVTTYKETFQKAQEIAINISEKFKEIAPIEWIICEGNHDQHKSFYFTEFLNAWFRNDSNIIVNNSQEKRKYHRWKNNLFMYTHGDTEKFDMLPLRMAQSRKKDFAECDFYYIGVGHLHHKSNGIVRTSIDSNGIEVNILPSLVSSSRWESNKWYQHIKECVCNIYTTNGKEETWFYHPTYLKNNK